MEGGPENEASNVPDEVVCSMECYLHITWWRSVQSDSVDSLLPLCDGVRPTLLLEQVVLEQ